MSATTDTRTVRLAVPELVSRPVVGTSCCASTAEAIVAQELFMLPGIDDVVVDVDAGAVMVTYRPGSVSEGAIDEALEAIGYPVSRAA
jgi:copper chaperone CopZ